MFSIFTMALTQTPSEGAKVLIDDAIQALKANDVKKQLYT
jgi:hypothetical protein